MLKYILIALVAYNLGQNAWAYPTQDGISFGYDVFGYHYSFTEESE
jgi:hypothetical protein